MSLVIDFGAVNPNVTFLESFTRNGTGTVTVKVSGNSIGAYIENFNNVNKKRSPYIHIDICIGRAGPGRAGPGRAGDLTPINEADLKKYLFILFILFIHL